MKTNSVNRPDLIGKIIAVVRSANLRRYSCAERYELIGTDGKTYGIGGFPRGVRFAKRGAAYYVSEASSGCTYGARFATRAAWEQMQAERSDHHDMEFRQELEAMDDKRLCGQADFWLKNEAVA